MEFDNKTMMSLLTIAIAAMVSSFGYLYKIRRESKKSYRKVLYTLLEVRYAILTSQFDPHIAADQYIEHYIGKLTHKGEKIKKEDFPVEFEQMITEHFKNMMSGVKTEISEQLIQPYEEALIEMSLVNPVLAYTLRGKEKLDKLIANTNNYEKDFFIYLNQVNSDTRFNKTLQSTLNTIKQDVIDEALASLDKDLKAVAYKCGLIDYIKCIYVLKNGISSSSSQYDYQELDQQMNMVLEVMLSMEKEGTSL